MELLVGVLHHGHSHPIRHINALSLQSGGGVGDQLRLEGRVTPCLGDDLAEIVIIFSLVSFPLMVKPDYNLSNLPVATRVSSE